ncbi:GlxA family transcriptional regulator [Brachybacterium subflavum]|uniref:GlxA family transcriptional regulator n=1 Tax=Brachybacterium subflavum TaxID=2585206 RepID=UPI00187A9351|nr:helix-turn-helix domain-containing protein [Brachybacterium subflavum]
MHKESARGEMSRRVAVLTLPGVNGFDASIAPQVLGECTGHLYDVTMCSLEAGPVTTSSGYALQVTNSLDVLATTHTLIVPGHRIQNRPPAVLGAIREAHAAGVRIVSICTGAFILADSGILDHRRATTHWDFAHDLRSRAPLVEVVPENLYIQDAGIWTSGGVAAGIDLCLRLVDIDHGADAALHAARLMVMPIHRSGDQRQYRSNDGSGDGRGTSIRPALEWAVDHLNEPVTVQAMAARAQMSPRSFTRHVRSATGMSPKTWLIDQRISLASRLLERDHLSVEAVAQRAGLGSAANLRAHFRAHRGVSPREYRASFRP